MTDHEDDLDLSAALSRLRTDVRRAVPHPAATQLRRQADRRLRTRRTATALVAAAVVGAVLVGGGLLWSGDAPTTPPVPGGSVSPTPAGAPSAQARPSKPVAARPDPQVPATWAGVDWANATITLPAHPGCPSGPVKLGRLVFNGVAAIAGPTAYPRMAISPETLVYGDVTGDGQTEAILNASCSTSEEDSGDGQGELLVIRRDSGVLRAIAWVGPRGAQYSDHWIAANRLVLDVKPRYDDWGYRLGATRVYQWNGQGFTEVTEVAGDPGMVPGGGGPAPAVDVGPVAALTGCPAATLRFGEDGRATAAGTTWDVFQPTAPDYLQHVVDLDGNGRRTLLVAITCGRTDTDPGHEFAAVLERLPDGSFRAVDAVLPPAGTSISGWQFSNGTLTWQYGRLNETVQELRYTWNGEYFQR